MCINFKQKLLQRKFLSYNNIYKISTDYAILQKYYFSYNILRIKKNNWKIKIKKKEQKCKIYFKIMIYHNFTKQPMPITSMINN